MTIYIYFLAGYLKNLIYRRVLMDTENKNGIKRKRYKN